MADRISVLFVCLGNICRSTMAEGVFQHMAKQPEYKDKIGTVDSCGTASYHVGDEPDDRTMMILEQNGIDDYEHLARKFRTSDFDKFDYIFAMDKANLSDLQRLQKGHPDGKAKVMLFGEFGGTGKVEMIGDPYYGGQNGFDKAYEQCVRFSENFMKQVVVAGVARP